MPETISDAELAVAARWLARREAEHTRPGPPDAHDFLAERTFLEMLMGLMEQRSKIVEVPAGCTPFVAGFTKDRVWMVVAKPESVVGKRILEPASDLEIPDGQICYVAEIHVRVAESDRPGRGPRKPLPLPD